MSIKFLVLGGGGYFGFFVGGECRFYFYGRADFSDFCKQQRQTESKKYLAVCKKDLPFENDSLLGIVNGEVPGRGCSK